MSDVANTKDGFIGWLASRNENKETIDEHIVNLEAISICYALYLKDSFNIWEVTNPKLIDAILNAATSSKNAEENFPIVISKTSLLTLKKYLTELKNSEDKTHIEWRTQSSVDNEIDFNRKLEKATAFLQSRYKGLTVPTLRQLQKENPEINFGYFNTWTQRLHGKTAGQYLTEIGILSEKVLDTRPSSERLLDYTNILIKRYSDKPAESLTQVINENPDISVSMINIWARELFNQTAKDYLVEKGIIRVSIMPTVKTTKPVNKASTPKSAGINRIEKHSLPISLHEGKKIIGYFYNGEKIIDAYPRKKDKYTFYVHERMPISSEVIQKYNLEINPHYSETDKFKYKGFLTKGMILELIYDAYSDTGTDAKELSDSKTRNASSPLDASAKSIVPNSIDGNNQSLSYYFDSLKVIIDWLKNRYSVNLSYDYLSDTSHSRNDLLYKVYYNNKDIMWVYMIFSKRSHYISLETDPHYLSEIDLDSLHCDKTLIRESRPCLKMFFTRFDDIENTLHQICDAIESNCEKTKEIQENSVYQPSEDSGQFSPQINLDSTLQSKVESIVLNADLSGITPEDLAWHLPSASVLSIKRVRDLSSKIIDLNGVMIHVDALVDFDDAANKIHEIIEKLLTKNNGYISSSQLFEYVRADLQMFLNDNDLCDEQKVFDIAKYLFSKVNWQGYHYEFTAGKHISNAGENALKTNMDIFEKFARDEGGVFQWNDLIKYLEKVGVKTGNLRGQMKIGYEPIFFYVTSDELVTVESMNINDEWINKVNHALHKLFNDVGDHIIIRNIAPIWYDQLPELPRRIQWTPILLQYVLQFYGDKLDARTIHSELSTQYDSIHSLLVSKNSDLHSFGDAVIAFVVDNGIEERHYQAEEFRKILAYGRLIGNLENINNMQRAIGNDTRFAWDATGDVLTLLI